MPGKFHALHLGLFEQNHVSDFLRCNQVSNSMNCQIALWDVHWFSYDTDNQSRLYGSTSTSILTLDGTMPAFLDIRTVHSDLRSESEEDFKSICHR